MLTPALNPLAFAAAALSLSAHVVIVGALLLQPDDQPAEVAHLVTIVAAPASSPTTEVLAGTPTLPSEAPQPTPARDAAETTPPEVAVDATPQRPAAAKPRTDVVAQTIPSGQATPRRKPAAQIPASIRVVDNTEIAALPPARSDRGPAKTASVVETQIAIRPGNSQPRYPLAARKRGYEGQTIIRVEVSGDGNVATTEVLKSSGYAPLDVAARDAVAGWQFQPATRDGRPTSGRIDVPVEFRLR
mgnify:CR=1 FL=1